MYCNTTTGHWCFEIAHYNHLFFPDQSQDQILSFKNLHYARRENTLKKTNKQFLHRTFKNLLRTTKINPMLNISHNHTQGASVVEQHPPNRTNSFLNNIQNVIGIKFLSQKSYETLVEMKIQVSLSEHIDGNIIKGVIYDMANSNMSSDQNSIENFAILTAKYFFREFNVNYVKLDVEQSEWNQIIKNNKAGLIQADCLRFVHLTYPRNGDISLCSGIKSLDVPKKSEVSQLLESNSVKMDVFWKLPSTDLEEHSKRLVKDGQSVVDFNEIHEKVRECIWNGVKDVKNIDLKVQCNNVLDNVSVIKCIFISIPNSGHKMEAFTSRLQPANQPFSYHGRPVNNLFINHFHRMNRDFYASKL